MDKLKMSTKDLTEENIAKIAELFPNVITEFKDDDGETKKGIDFELLKQELSDVLVDGSEERYRLDWPGKKLSLLKANTPITDRTLRPCIEESVDFENTENLYLEGDNFEILKLLQESYLNKIKMIYIDPPYNTGTAMIYNNKFAKSNTEFSEEIGSVDEDGVKMFKNTDTNGRFHSDWLSMMYERIVVSRDLLTDDGFMALAIDHNELHNLTSICDKIFGEQNRLGVVTVVHKPEGRQFANFFSPSNEFMLVYSKNINLTNFQNVVLKKDKEDEFNEIDEKGNYKLKNFIRLTDGKYSLKENKPEGYYPIYVSKDLLKFSITKIDNYIEVYPITERGIGRVWKTFGDTFMEKVANDSIVAKSENGNIVIYEKLRPSQVMVTHWVDKKYHGYHYGTKIINELLGEKTFDFPKSLYLLIDILKLTTSKEDIILDFFSGSATTAHAVMQLNAEDSGNRKFIMAQLPEKTEKNSEAYKAGYKNISDIGKERIRRVRKKIQEDHKDKDLSNVDFGFRVFKTDSTNMKDVYYKPSELNQEMLTGMEDNIKEDRSAEDLLTQVILNLGLELSLKIEKKEIAGNNVFFVDENSLVVCFDEKINFDIIDEIAKIQPLKVVFRDACFKNDSDRINVEEKFKQMTPKPRVSVI